MLLNKKAWKPQDLVHLDTLSLERLCSENFLPSYTVDGLSSCSCCQAYSVSDLLYNISSHNYKANMLYMAQKILLISAPELAYPSKWNRLPRHWWQKSGSYLLFSFLSVICHNIYKLITNVDIIFNIILWKFFCKIK